MRSSKQIIKNGNTYITMYALAKKYNVSHQYIYQIKDSLIDFKKFKGLNYVNSNQPILNSYNSPKIPDNYYSIREICNITKLSYHAVYARVRKSGIETIKIKRKIYVKSEDIKKLL